MIGPDQQPLELWGGTECTVVRVGDEYRDQVRETGHRTRLGDLDALAELGVTTVRYPILWETIAPESPHELDFSWHDERLARLRELGIRVIGGLVHHGSGPRYTQLLDDRFPEKLRDYAGRVARRYPWIDMWTPVNEPLTTARFSCLYGHWFPHLRDEGQMYRALANQCVGTLEAMAAIREVNPAAQLLVTEDIGRAFGTPELAAQVEYENVRRWLSLDLLCGRLRPGHELHDRVQPHVPQELLDGLATGRGKPDIIGVNHYLTSERYLDHRIERYPHVEAGSNGAQTYVDLEAIRVHRLRREVGPEKRLQEVWDRYRLPMAVTEVHHGCTREEQVRWLQDVWTAATTVRGRGADIRAVTLWSVFGAVDWRSLLTERNGSYDVGAYDTRGSKPRPTMLARAAADLAAGRRLDHPVLKVPGWWKRPGRHYMRPNFHTLSPSAARSARPILITGATGTLGQAFHRICSHRGLPHVVTSRDELDIVDDASIRTAIKHHRPWAVINAAGFVRTWEAAERAEECHAANALGPERLASACRSAGVPLVTFSSDLVFDGSLGRSYTEGDAPAPRCTYGLSKLECEQRVLAVLPEALVIRTSAFFGPWDKFNFLYTAVRDLKQGREVVASQDNIVSPTYVPDLVHATLDLLLDRETGVWHLTNQGAVSWYDLAQDVADRARLSGKQIRVSNGSGRTDTSLSSHKGLLLRPLDQALRDFIEQSPALQSLLAQHID
ncbi:family 1 glycosylhydrolase [Sphingomonas sp. LHG3443-2]|uniref:family 1 glycosylhydrolase n=1 Tax=Sphingomonas sp. LHG3443-2 TaxID=2804639 RepID=UPI003CEAFBC1